MAASRMEEMAIGELSNRVAAGNAREELADEARQKKLIKETTARILAIVAPTMNGIPSHPYRSRPKGGCYSCHYYENHPIHQA